MKTPYGDVCYHMLAHTGENEAFDSTGRLRMLELNERLIPLPVILCYIAL